MTFRVKEQRLCGTAGERLMEQGENNGVLTVLFSAFHFSILSSACCRLLYFHYTF